MNIDAASLTDLVAAIGALGMASFALVDSSKIGRHGGISKAGFSHIEAAVQLFHRDAKLPERNAMAKAPPVEEALLHTLHSHWINGVALADQKAIAKTLIKLRLTEDTAKIFAEATGVDAHGLKEVAARMSTGEALEASQTNILGRFDLAVTAILDAAYQRADQRYRNACKIWASVASVLLAGVGGLLLDAPQFADPKYSPMHLGLYILCGILAVPLAPISKDLASALSAGVKVAQTLKR